MSTTKQAILQMKIENQLVDIMVRTNFDNVLDSEGVTLSTKIASMIANIEALPTTEGVNSAVKTACDNLYNKILGKTDDTTTIDEAYDTLKEVADWITNHGEVAATLTNTVSQLREDVNTLQETVNASNHTHSNKIVLDGITGEKVTSWDNAATHAVDSTVHVTADQKIAWDAKGRIIASTTAPEDLTEKDLFIHIVG